MACIARIRLRRITKRKDRPSVPTSPANGKPEWCKAAVVDQKAIVKPIKRSHLRAASSHKHCRLTQRIPSQLRQCPTSYI